MGIIYTDLTDSLFLDIKNVVKLKKIYVNKREIILSVWEREIQTYIILSFNLTHEPHNNLTYHTWKLIYSRHNNRNV